MIELNCLICKTPFYVKKYRKFTAKLCSYDCLGKYKSKLKKGKIPSNLAFLHSSKEVRNKIGLARKGKKHSEETKEKIRQKAIGRKLSEEHKEKLRQSHLGKPVPWSTGANSPWWKGGITPINLMIRKSQEYKLWRTAVFTRDSFTCIWCGLKEKIEADHIKSFSLYPELRFAIDNGRTLCRVCHKTTDNYGGNSKNKH